MKLIKNARSYGVASIAAMAACMVQAKDINGLVLAEPNVPVNTNASLQISFTTEDTSLCGVVIDWGNGTQQSIRLGHDQHKTSPATINHAYLNPGNYNIKLEGRFMSRGLNSALACNVLTKQVSVKVIDPAAEKLAAETRAAQLAAEAATQQAAAREKEVAERERLALAAAEKAKQDLLIQQAATREMELSLRARELERREAQLRKDEEARRTPGTSRPSAPAAPAAVALSASAAAGKAREQASVTAAPVAAATPEPVASNEPVTYAARKALVIGNDRYAKVSPLQNAVADAEAMAKSLEAVGYKVFKHLNVDEKKFKQAVRDFRQNLAGGDEVLFFYAGHAVQLGSANYLLPIDVQGEQEEQVKDESILLQKVLDDLEEKKTKFALAVIDACRDNPFKSSKGRAIGGRGLAPTTAATGQMVMFSAGSGQQALDRLGDNDKEKNGLFTRIFIKEMAKPGVSVDRVLRNVRTEVVRLAKSIGHEQTPALYDQAVGDFYFKR
ncbi:caspase family protein [Limnohabitans sp. G3-2]|uniref:caspase family protein n=1 Tax=Limnohabitans sp. G3-2 TaxID=1100711 RepID=UPI000C1EB628|nr:caspase family protein [Limnohabitans sp. G3-2]PIT75873.1 hypothetical protein B9Z31_06335 [Limnohabitans sp. G3-2]